MAFSGQGVRKTRAHRRHITKGIHMKTQQLGQFTIDRVTEYEGSFAPLKNILPSITQADIDAHADWLKPNYVDEQDRAIMSFHSYLIQTGRHRILVDACVGNDKERPHRASWNRAQFPFMQSLAQARVSPEDIDFVCCTHMHADHVGWNTRLQNGQWVPTFPNARYVFAQTEYSHWEKTHREALAKGEPSPNHGSFADSVLPVVEAGRALMVQDDFEFEPGLYLGAAHGHTPGNCVLHAHSQGRRAIFSGDILHTPAQLINTDWSSNFCFDPQTSAQVRKDLVHSIADTDTLLMTGHFPTPVAGRVVSHGDHFRFAGADQPAA